MPVKVPTGILFLPEKTRIVASHGGTDFDAFFTPDGALFIPFLRWFLYHVCHTNEEHITTILKESEVMAVRKVVCIAGAECVVIRPVKQALYAVEPWQAQGDLPPQKKSHVLLDVTTDDRHYGGLCLFQAFWLTVTS